MTPQKKKNAAAVALSKLGASKGGVARAKKLSPERRAEIAKAAIKARWQKAKMEAAKKS
jgi:ABC-type phosphate/phosphonate transport system ATPase subunit